MNDRTLTTARKFRSVLVDGLHIGCSLWTAEPMTVAISLFFHRVLIIGVHEAPEQEHNG